MPAPAAYRDELRAAQDRVAILEEKLADRGPSDDDDPEILLLVATRRNIQRGAARADLDGPRSATRTGERRSRSTRRATTDTLIRLGSRAFSSPDAILPIALAWSVSRPA
jgi:hypothetical protein